MQITCPVCAKQIPINSSLRGTTLRCSRCNAPMEVPSGSQLTDRPFQAASRPSGKFPVSNDSIILTAVFCMFGLCVVFAITMVWASLNRRAANAPMDALGAVENQSNSAMQLAEFREGYSMMLPKEFGERSREEIAGGTIVYQFRTKEGYRLTVAIIPDAEISRITSPPNKLAQTLVKNVPELAQGVEGEVLGERVMPDGMPASVFRYYEKETFRGVTFTYLMVAMDRGKKLVIKFDGKFGGYHEEQEIFQWPDQWYESLMTLQVDR